MKRIVDIIEILIFICLPVLAGILIGHGNYLAGYETFILFLFRIIIYVYQHELSEVKKDVKDLLKSSSDLIRAVERMDLKEIHRIKTKLDETKK